MTSTHCSASSWLKVKIKFRPSLDDKIPARDRTNSVSFGAARAFFHNLVKLTHIAVPKLGDGDGRKGGMETCCNSRRLSGGSCGRRSTASQLFTCSSTGCLSVISWGSSRSGSVGGVGGETKRLVCELAGLSRATLEDPANIVPVSSFV